jgi:hypothetical protein
LDRDDGTADAIEFSSLPWHDSKLLGWSVTAGSNGAPQVILDVFFRDSEIFSGRVELQFQECRGLDSDVDLLAKRLCSDQIATAWRERADESEEDFVAELEERFDLYRGESMKDLFVFGVKLIHPGGQLIIVARSFSLAAPMAESSHAGL